MNFRELYYAAQWAIWAATIKSQSLKHDCNFVRISGRGDFTRAVSTKPLPFRVFEKLSEVELKELSSYYTMAFQYDVCWICGRQMLPLDLTERWYKLHPDVPAPDWSKYKK